MWEGQKWWNGVNKSLSVFTHVRTNTHVKKKTHLFTKPSIITQDKKSSSSHQILSPTLHEFKKSFQSSQNSQRIYENVKVCIRGLTKLHSLSPPIVSLALFLAVVTSGVWQLQWSEGQWFNSLQSVLKCPWARYSNADRFWDYCWWAVGSWQDRHCQPRMNVLVNGWMLRYCKGLTLEALYSINS